MNALSSPLAIVLVKWTVLLALAWGVHALLRRRHSRWRQMLWRGILCVGFLVPLMQFVPVPVFQIPVFEPTVTPLVNSADVPAAAPSHPVVADKSPAPLATRTVEAKSVANNPPPLPKQISLPQIPWQTWPVMIWAAIAVLAGLRLMRFQWQLNHLRRQSHPAETALQTQVWDIQLRLGVKPTIEVRVSDSISSAFACGPLKPAILLPRKMAVELSSDETSALLLHEVAHFCRRDLFWCVAWRWMQAIFWFHPLIWKIPAAHSLACEQECDRMASGQMAERGDYRQLLARLALRVLALPKVETQLALNATSQIARRLNYLKRGEDGGWDWRCSVAAIVLVILLFALATGYEFSPKGERSKVKFKKVLVVVEDEDGKPIAGASMQPNGFRVKGVHAADAYWWNTNDFGPPEKVMTDKDGKAWLKYPVMAIQAEKELTGALFFYVSHPGYCTADVEDFRVNGSNKPIRMTRGITLQVSGYYGADHEPVREIIPNLNQEEIHTNDWTDEGNGVFSFDKLSPGNHLIQLMGRLPSGEIVYSDTAEFLATYGNPCKLELEMKPGLRLEGRLDDGVPRPVKNGRVLIVVRPKEFPAWNNFEDIDPIFKKYPDVNFWRSYRPIAADGTFVFESIPPGGLDVIVCGDGFASKNGSDFQEHANGKWKKIPGFAVPQDFSLTAPVTKIVVITEPTATLKLTATTKWGTPIEGATVYVNPNVIRINGIFGNYLVSSEEPFQKPTPLPKIHYYVTTDKNGVALIRNIPASDRGIEVDDPHYQVPIQEPTEYRSRYIHTTYQPGMTNELNLVMEPKGEDYIDSR